LLAVLGRHQARGGVEDGTERGDLPLRRLGAGVVGQVGVRLATGGFGLP
jgi:hypothetical protein